MAISIRVSDNTGDGNTQNIPTNPGTTLSEFLSEKGLGGTNRSVRYNNRPANDNMDEELQDGDRISITPTKVAGALEVENSAPTV